MSGMRIIVGVSLHSRWVEVNKLVKAAGVTRLCCLAGCGRRELVLVLSGLESCEVWRVYCGLLHKLAFRNAKSIVLATPK
jgi:hypothetical protein